MPFMTSLPIASAPAARPPVSRQDEHALAERAWTIARCTALGVLGDREAAADVAQEVAVQVLPRRGSLRDEAALDAWIHRIPARAALNAARRDRSRRAAELAALAARPRWDRDADEALGAALAALF